MDNQTVLARGLGYVPGIARGVLRRGVAVPADAIALITQEQIGALAQAPAGIIVMDGAPFSHQAIALLGLGVPAVIVGRAEAAACHDGLEVVIDGHRGTVTTAAGNAALAGRALMLPHAGQCIMTPDGVAVELRASVRSVAAAQKARALGATAIGLVRTEFFEPADGRCPDSDYYTRGFTALCAAAAPLSVTFRLLDIATDKLPAWVPRGLAMPGALGLQGVRLFGQTVIADVVRAQLAVIGQLSRSYPVSILLPYLVRHEELRHWMLRVRAQVPADIPIGAMVETPAGALDLEHWFDQADFIAVGCNDLMQCLFAADRDQADVRAYLDPYAPVLYRLFKEMAQRAGEHIAQIQLCGVLSQLHGVLPILLGLGYRRFSVDAAQIPYLAETVRGTTRKTAETLAQAVCAACDSADVLERLHITSTNYQPFLAGNDLSGWCRINHAVPRR